MNLAFLTFNVTFLAGLLCYQHFLGRVRKALSDEELRLLNKDALLEALRVYLRNQRDQIDADYVQLIKAATIVDQRAAMFGPDEVPDPGDVDPSQRRWMVN
jgi:hypothetical protein